MIWLSVTLTLLVLSDASGILQSMNGLTTTSAFLVVSIVVLAILVLILVSLQVRRYSTEQHQTLLLLQTLVQQMPAGLLLLTPNYQVILSNTLAEELLGLESSKKQNNGLKLPYEVVLEDGTPCPGLLFFVEQAISTKQPVSNIVIGLKVTPSQSASTSLLSPTTEFIRWLLVSITPLFSKTKQVEKIICIFSEISRQNCDEIERLQIQLASNQADSEVYKQSLEDLEKQSQRSKLLAEITLKIRQSFQIEVILQTTVIEIQKLLEIDRVLIYRFASDWAGTVVTEAVLPGYPVILGEKIEDPCFREKYIEQYAKGRVRIIPDLDNCDLQPCHIETLQKFAVKANLVVPILQRENLWGLLIAHHCQEPRRWNEFEIELLQQLANQLSIALAQAEFLEQEIHQRQQLAQQNMALEQAFKKLQKAQSQLVQSEKMVSLGQMVAGVAHEINNPVTFISGNLTPAYRYAKNLLKILQLYEQHYPQAVSEIQEAVEELDVEFIKEDLPKLLDSMQIGADRIRNIVLSLRNFSRLDEAEKKRVDIHEGLNSTLLILQHRLKAVAEKPTIQLIKNYGTLPPVECYAGQLNQVFMNILSNAVDAVENVPSPVITITTSVVTEGDSSAKNNGNGSSHSSDIMSHHPIAVIRIADNGAGMSEQVKCRLFDPFFTTKPPGKGTGLGLSISYQIVVEKHGGRLSCISVPRQGSEFIVEIPIKQVALLSKG